MHSKQIAIFFCSIDAFRYYYFISFSLLDFQYFSRSTWPSAAREKKRRKTNHIKMTFNSPIYKRLSYPYKNGIYRVRNHKHQGSGNISEKKNSNNSRATNDNSSTKNKTKKTLLFLIWSTNNNNKISRARMVHKYDPSQLYVPLFSLTALGSCVAFLLLLLRIV